MKALTSKVFFMRSFSLICRICVVLSIIVFASLDTAGQRLAFEHELNVNLYLDIQERFLTPSLERFVFEPDRRTFMLKSTDLIYIPLSYEVADNLTLKPFCGLGYQSGRVLIDDNEYEGDLLLFNIQREYLAENKFLTFGFLVDYRLNTYILELGFNFRETISTRSVRNTDYSLYAGRTGDPIIPIIVYSSPDFFSDQKEFQSYDNLFGISLGVRKSLGKVFDVGSAVLNLAYRPSASRMFTTFRR